MSLNHSQSAEHVRALVACLEDEYQALLAADSARLGEVLARKQQALADLAAATAAGPPAGATRLPPALVQALTHARRMNQRNALTLAPRLAANRARLRFLQAALGRTATYTPDGALAAAAQGGSRARGSA